MRKIFTTIIRKLILKISKISRSCLIVIQSYLLRKLIDIANDEVSARKKIIYLQMKLVS